MHPIRVILLTLLLALIGVGIAGAQLPTKIDPKPPLSTILHDHQVAGAAVALVSKDSIIWIGTIGMANKQRNMPVTDSTLFGIGSIAKTFLSLAAMVAQEKKLLDLNQPISHSFPLLAANNPWQATRPVRLVHLLEHTAGFDEAHLSLFAQANSSTPFKDVLKRSQSALMNRWPPGHYYAYNNLGALLAAKLIEQRVGEPFEQFVHKHLFEPLAMKQATYHRSLADSAYLAKGYAGSDFAEEPWPDLPQWPAGSLLASIDDMATLVSLFLNQGRFQQRQLIAPTSIQRMETPETSWQAQQGIRYGYGKGLRGRIEHGYHFLGHDGSYGGFLSEFGYCNELGVGYVILLNNRDGRQALKAIKQLLFGYLLPPTKPRSFVRGTVSGSQLKALSGCYQPITSEMSITQCLLRLVDLQLIDEQDGQLFQKSMLGDEQRLLPVGDALLFRRLEEPLATSVFVQDKQGSWQWLDETAYRQIPVWWGYLQFYTAAGCLLTILISLLVLLVWVPIRIVKRKREGMLLQVLPLLAVGSLLGMVVSIAVLYNPLEAVLFMLCSWSFLLFSIISLAYSVNRVYWQRKLSKSQAYHALLLSVCCCVVALYLYYWDVIGLTLWNY